MSTSSSRRLPYVNSPQDFEKDKTLRPSRFDKWRGLIIVVSYGLVSLTITFFNKAVFSTYNFNAANMLTLGQMIFSIIFLEVLRFFNMLQYENFKFETAKKLFTLAISFFSMVATGLAALKYINIPMFSALRRFTTLVVIAAQYFMLDKRVPADEFLSVVAMIVGAVFASYGDLAFDFIGYSLTALNCFTTAIYLVIINAKSTETGLNNWALMYYNNILCAPIVIIFIYFLEYDDVVQYEQYGDVGFQIFFFLSSVLAFVLNYLVFLCTTFNTPLATSVTGQLKAILQTIIGLFTFGGVEMNFTFGLGLSISTFAGIWYGQVKYAQQARLLRAKEVTGLHKVVVEPSK